MAHWAASIHNLASSVHPNHELQTAKENEIANKNEDTPHFYNFQMAHRAYAVTRILSSPKSDQ
jgi:hypothetical protein